MADAKDEIAALKASIDAGFSSVHGKLDEHFARVNAKLDDIRNDIKVISEARLAPLEQKQIRTGLSPNWPRAVDVDDLKEG